MARVTISKPRVLSADERADERFADRVQERKVTVDNKKIGSLYGLAEDPTQPSKVTTYRFEPFPFAAEEHPAADYATATEAREQIEAKARTLSGARPKHEIHRATREEVRDAIADLEVEGLRDATAQPSVVGIYSIVRRLLGFDPLTAKNTDTNFGGRSKDSWVNEHLSMTVLRRVLDEMLDAGEIVKLTDPGRWSSTVEERRLSRAVRFGYGLKVGYLLAETYEAALDRADAGTRNNRRAELLAKAKEELARRHETELSEIYAKLCNDADLDPERENTALED